MCAKEPICRKGQCVFFDAEALYMSTLAQRCNLCERIPRNVDREVRYLGKFRFNLLSVTVIGKKVEAPRHNEHGSVRSRKTGKVPNGG
jgi:hypothetical protein